jgi:hypothetical protein
MTTKQPTQIRESHGRKRLSLQESSIIDACKRICAAWHNRLGACLVLDYDRLLALRQRLIDQQIPEDHILAGVEAYAYECLTNKQRIANPQMRMDFATFIRSGKLEQWMEIGLAARSKKAAAESRQLAAGNEIRQKQELMLKLRRAGLDWNDLHRQAVIALGNSIEDTSTNNPKVLAKIEQLATERIESRYASPSMNDTKPQSTQRAQR